MKTAVSRPERPPADLSQLRALALRIRRGDAATTLGPKAYRTLEGVLALNGDPALLSITSLAARLQVHPSTITRLARSLGYANFRAFQRALLAEPRAADDFYSRQARPALTAAQNPALDQVMRLCRENQANIDRFLERFDGESFTAAAGLLVEAPRVAVHGIRQFHSLASFLVYGLRMIRSDVALLNASGLGAAEELAAMHPGDVLVSTSCAPYSAEVVTVARVAADHDLHGVALTDSLASPLVAYCEQSILVPHASSFLSNSMTAFTAVAECLVNACAAARPDAAEDSLASRDRAIRELRIES